MTLPRMGRHSEERSDNMTATAELETVANDAARAFNEEADAMPAATRPAGEGASQGAQQVSATSRANAGRQVAGGTSKREGRGPAWPRKPGSRGESKPGDGGSQGRGSARRGGDGRGFGGRGSGDGRGGDGRRAGGDQGRGPRRLLTWLFLFGVLASSFYMFLSRDAFQQINTSEGIELLKGDTVEQVQITEGTQEVRLWLSSSTSTIDSDGKKHNVGKKVEFEYVEAQANQIATLAADADPKRGYNSIVPTTSVWTSMLTMFLPLVFIFVIFMYFLPRIQSGMGGFGKIRGKKAGDPEQPDVTFADVAGEDEAVEELREVTDFLTAPERFHALGAKIPRGVLLYGPPGTGKTLLARAVAGEAGVPFFSISASEFVEMFVGVGASRVRDLFAKAKAAAPAIIFVDEIDAVGRGRGVGVGGGNDEREQTLNQLLVELDGFDDRANVILIAATNRPDVLDQALLRPGRFDRQVAVDAPDLKGREAILAVHAKGKPFASDVDLEMVARRTPGYTGADLANILNEAALLAARFGRDAITVADVDEAIDRVMAGPQRRSRPMSDSDKLLTAYHEAGHAIAAAALHNADPVSKVTILPRGRALGYTMVLPTEDRYSRSRNDLLDELTYAMGGRVAEEIVFHDPTTGASNDIQKATATARAMVTEYGMSSEVGIIRLVADDSDPLTRGIGGSSETYSDGTMSTIDQQVRALVENAHREAWQILAQNRSILDELAQRLIDQETVLENELKEIFSGIVKAPERERWNSFDIPADLYRASEIAPISATKNLAANEAGTHEAAVNEAGGSGVGNGTGTRAVGNDGAANGGSTNEGSTNDGDTHGTEA